MKLSLAETLGCGCNMCVVLGGVETEQLILTEVEMSEML